MTLAEYFTYKNVLSYLVWRQSDLFCTFFMHVLNINTFLLTINVIILKEFLVNKLLNIHESGVSARALSGRFPYMIIKSMFASTKV